MTAGGGCSTWFVDVFIGGVEQAASSIANNVGRPLHLLQAIRSIQAYFRRETYAKL